MVDQVTTNPDVPDPMSNTRPDVPDEPVDALGLCWATIGSAAINPAVEAWYSGEAVLATGLPASEMIARMRMAACKLDPGHAGAHRWGDAWVTLVWNDDEVHAVPTRSSAEREGPTVEPLDYVPGDKEQLLVCHVGEGEPLVLLDGDSNIELAELLTPLQLTVLAARLGHWHMQVLAALTELTGDRR